MIALYIRCSTREQAENGYTIGEQQDRLKKYCGAMGWKSVKVYTDAGFSGSNTNRPSLQRLIKDVESHKVQKVVVYKLDRLSRSQKDTLYLIEDVFLKNGCDFVSMSENFDTSSPFGRAMIGILAVFAQLEREQIKERMTMGREARAKEGKYAGSHLHPIGYDYINGELVVNEFEKMQIQQIFEDYASGLGVAKIAKKLNDAGMTHKYGKWTETVVRSLLPRKTYIGFVRFGEEWFKGTHEPIISEELFDKVQQIIKTKRDDYVQRHISYGSAVSYLGGMITCAECGEKYYKHRLGSRGYHYDWYCCRNKYKAKRYQHETCKNTNWKMSELDDLIFEEIRKLKFESPRKPRKMPDRTPQIKKRINDLEKQIDRLMELYTLQDMPLDKVEKKLHEINDQKNKLENELQTQKVQNTTLEDAKRLVSSFDDVLEHGSLDDVRTVIRSLIDHIEIDGEDVRIYWNFDL